MEFKFSPISAPVRTTEEDAAEKINSMIIAHASGWGEELAAWVHELWVTEEYKRAWFPCPKCARWDLEKQPDLTMELRPGKNGEVKAKCKNKCSPSELRGWLRKFEGADRPNPPSDLDREALTRPGERELGQNPFGDAWRFILNHASVLMLSFNGKDYAEPFLANAHGLWSREANTLLDLHADTCEDWAEEALVRQKSGASNHADTLRFIRHLQKSKAPSYGEQMLKSLGAASLAMDRDKDLDLEALTMVKAEDVDKPGRYFAAANGVVDLTTGHLLTPEEGRKHALTTRSGMAKYVPDAQHEAVDQLFHHLDPVRAEYLQACLGRSLWGQPDRMALVVVGERGSGKSTLFSALIAALGSYVGLMSEDALKLSSKQHKSGPNEERRVLVECRLALGEETANWPIGPERLKAFTGGRPTIEFQAKYQQSEMRRMTATVVLSANATPRLGLDDPAVAERVKILRYDAPPERNPMVKIAFDSGERKAAEAMLALLVRSAVANPPEKTIETPDIVLEDIESEIRGQLTPFQIWLKDAVEKVPLYGASGAPMGVSTRELWEAWAEECQVSAGEASVNGMAKDGVAKVFRNMYHPEPAKMVRRGHRVESTYLGWRLIGYEEAQGVL